MQSGGDRSEKQFKKQGYQRFLSAFVLDTVSNKNETMGTSAKERAEKNETMGTYVKERAEKNESYRVLEHF